MAIVPLAVTVLAGWTDPVLATVLHGYVLVEMGLWLAIGAAVAVYGSHKISTLRREAFEARQLGQYRLKRRLGSGGMGEVYLAEHRLLRRPCAVKLIRPESAGDPRCRARFEREVRAMAALTHPNTVEVYDYGHAEDGTFYYVMEYLPGPSMQELVERCGALPPGRAVHFLRQVCAALHEAHAAGLVQRDIKPSNIIVCERGGIYDVVKLLDFGLVQVAGGLAGPEKLTREGTVVGTPLYMSPEQAAGKESLDASSDIYSVGGVAYFLLAGRPPFRRPTTVQVLAAHVGEPVPRLAEVRPDVPADLEEVILRCLEKDPARRFPDVAALDRALAACRCAGAWTPEQAAAWWQEHPGLLRPAADAEDTAQAAGRFVPC